MYKYLSKNTCCILLADVALHLLIMLSVDMSCLRFDKKLTKPARSVEDLRMINIKIVI